MVVRKNQFKPGSRVVLRDTMKCPYTDAVLPVGAAGTVVRILDGNCLQVRFDNELYNGCHRRRDGWSWSFYEAEAPLKSKEELEALYG